MGFFKRSELLTSKQPIPRLPQCGSCGILKVCKSPKMPVTGMGKRSILIIGEAPGKDEDSQGKQFVGVTGQLLERTLAKYGINMRRDCWLTNSLICRPPDNRTPTSAEIGYCRPNLIKTIQELKPKIIVPLGGPAVDSLIGWLWKDQVGAISRWAGFRIPHQKLNAWICPTFHPSYVARSDNKGNKNPVVSVIWNYHLEEMSKLQGRPWKQVPNYESEIEPIFSAKEAAQTIRAFMEYGGRIAFDYETNMLKPDWKEAEIICASVCWEGKRTIAFPWYGEVVPIFKEMLQSKLKKIASNIKFEDRVTRSILKTSIKNWWWDTMNGAHVVDNRRDITGLKFQAFVCLGADSYDEHIKGSLKAKGNTRENRAKRDVDLRQLLVYCGLDSLQEFHVSLIQREIMGYES